MSVQCNESEITGLLDVAEVSKHFKIEKVMKDKKTTKLIAKGISEYCCDWLSDLRKESVNKLKKVTTKINSVGSAIGKGENSDKKVSGDETNFGQMSVSKLIKLGYLIWARKVRNKQDFPVLTVAVNNPFRGYLNHELDEGVLNQIPDDTTMNVFYPNGSKYSKDVKDPSKAISLDAAFATKVAIYLNNIVTSYLASREKFIMEYDKTVDLTGLQLKNSGKKIGNGYDGVLSKNVDKICNICQSAECIAKKKQVLAEECRDLVTQVGIRRGKDFVVNRRSKESEGNDIQNLSQNREENEAISNSGGGNAIKDKKEKDAKNSPKDGKTTAENQKKSM